MAERLGLVLWDVDHTLIENGGVSKEIYASAFERMMATPVRHPARTEGRTDHEIMRGMLVAHGLDPSRYVVADGEAVLGEVGTTKKAELRERGHALPGARKALQALGDTRGIVQSALTGNIRSNALVKLSAFGLDRHLDWDVGGFGSDGSVRADLVTVARRRAEQKYGVAEGDLATVLVGDTVRDVEAGIRGGARVLAVATGRTSEAELTDAGADAVMPGLDDTAAVVETVKRLSRQARVRPPGS